MAAIRKHDWDAIRNEYVIGYRRLNTSTGLEEVTYPSLKDLAKKYAVNEAYLRKIAGQEGWITSREAIRERLRFKTLQEAITGELSESAQFDARILWNANRLLAVVEAFFEQYDYIKLGADGNFHFVKDEAGEDHIKDIKISDLKGLVEILEKTHGLVRKTLGEPNRGVTVPEDLKRADVDKLIAQRDSLMRQLDGTRYEIEEIKKQLNAREKR